MKSCRFLVGDNTLENEAESEMKLKIIQKTLCIIFHLISEFTDDTKKQT